MSGQKERAHTVASDQALAEFRMRVAQLRKQRWQQIEYSEDPPQALLYLPDDSQDTYRRRGTGRRAGGRQTGWRSVLVNDSGKVVSKDVDPPVLEEPDAAAADADTPAAPDAT